jgi:uncharacterized membrane-anchored protein
MPDASSTIGGSPFAPAASAGWSLSARTQMLLAVAFVALQVGILAAMVALDSLPYAFGQRIKLPVEPVDPRDLFRGDYVVLGYEFNRLSPGQVPGLPTDESPPYRTSAGRDVYVALKPEGDHYVADLVSTTPPSRGPYLHGRTVGPHRAEFGIEAYYVQEGEGRRLENLIRQRRLLAEVAVWRGQAKLVRLVE